MPQPFTHRSAFERQIRTRPSMERNERQAYQTLTDSVVRRNPLVPPGRVVVTPTFPDHARTVGYFLIVLATAIGVCKAFVWVVVSLSELS